MAQLDPPCPSHPFIRFDLDLMQVAPAVWAVAGECASKFDHVAWSPLRRDTAAALERVYLAKYIQGTVAIEGTRVSEGQVESLLHGGGPPPGSVEYDAAEVENFIRALERIRGRDGSEPLPITPSHLCDLNRAVLRGVRTGEGINIGAFRHHHVAVYGYTPPAPDFLGVLIEGFCDWMRADRWRPVGALADVHPGALTVLRAVLAHLYFELIHPFGDGNGRVGRLLELEVLYDGGVPWPAALVLTNHYNRTKGSYFASLNRPLLNPGPAGVSEFLLYAVRGLRSGLIDQVRAIQKQVLDVSWHDLIYEMFRSQEHRAVVTRQRALALALSATEGPTPALKITDLNPDVARAYAGKSHRLLLRDLAKLESMKLVVRGDRGWAANKGLMLVFRPERLRTGISESA